MTSDQQKYSHMVTWNSFRRCKRCEYLLKPSARPSAGLTPCFNVCFFIVAGLFTAVFHDFDAKYMYFRYCVTGTIVFVY